MNVFSAPSQQVNWANFSALVRQFLRSDSFNLKELEKILILIDRKVVLQIKISARVFYNLGFCNSAHVRNFCFKNLFYFLLQQKKEAFITAPNEAIAAYNALLAKIFTKKIADSLSIKRKTPPPEKITEEKIPFESECSQIVRKSFLFQDLQKQVSDLEKTKKLRSLQKEILSDAESMKACEDALEEIKREIQERTKKLQELDQLTKNNLKDFAKLSFSRPDIFQEYGNKSISSTYEEMFSFLKEKGTTSMKMPENFLTKDEFSGWYFREESFRQQVRKAIDCLLCVQRLQDPLSNFLKETSALTKNLYERFALSFCSVLEEMIFYETPQRALQEYKGLIERQKEKLLSLEQSQIQMKKDLKKRAVVYLEQLYSTDLQKFKDLSLRSDEILKEAFPLSASLGPLLDEKTFEVIQKENKDFCDTQLAKISDLVETGKTRMLQFQEIKDFCISLSFILHELKKYPDLANEQEELIKIIERLSFPREDFTRLVPSALSEKIEHHYSDFLQIQNNIPQMSRAWSKKLEVAKKRVEMASLGIIRRLLEIFSRMTPYQDFKEVLFPLREYIYQKLKNDLYEFFQGKISSFDFEKLSSDLAYDHDVVVMRKELRYRAFRLREIRREVIRMYKQVQHSKRLLVCSGFSLHDVSFRLSQFAEKLRGLLEKSENPFVAFAEREHVEDVNRQFRSFWLQIEDLQAKVHPSIEDAVKVLKEKHENLKNAFLHTVNDLEEIVLLKDGTRPNLVSQFERDWTGLSPVSLQEIISVKIHTIESLYPFMNPFSYFMLISPSQLRKELILESIKIYEDVQNSTKFAKEMQYIKTFEEERVDEILEGFERIGLIEDKEYDEKNLHQAYRDYATRIRRTASKIREEIFFDIGFLDIRSIMDVSLEDIKNSILFALKKAKDLENPFKLILENTISKELQNELFCEWDFFQKAPIDETKSLENLLFDLRAFSILLFKNSIFMAQEKKNEVAERLFIHLLLSFVLKTTGRSLTDLRSQGREAWLSFWVCDLSKAEENVEGIDYLSFSKTDLQTQIDQFFTLLRKEKEISSNVQNLLQIQDEKKLQIKTYVENIPTEGKILPFFYISGYLSLFGAE